MPEKDPNVVAIEAHEEFMQHIELGRSRIRLLSLITIIVALLLGAGFFSQLVLPFVSGTRYVQVDLLNPALLAFQGVLLVLSAAWLYVGVVNYLFATRLGKSIQEARALERDLEEKITGQ